MAGGTFSVQNKIRPGAYINLRAIKEKSSVIGNRGIVFVVDEFNWGPEQKVVEINANEYLNNAARLLGLDSTMDKYYEYQNMFENATKAYFFNCNKGGTAATIELSTGITVTAINPGTAGNNIKIVVETKGENDFYLKTYFAGNLVDTQVVRTIDNAVENSFVKFTGTTATEFVTVAGKNLQGGLDGSSYDESEMASVVQGIAEVTQFNMFYDGRFKTVNENFVNMITTFRESLGKKVQMLIVDAGTTYGTNARDYEGLITFSVNQNEFSNVTRVTGYVLGLCAGTDVDTSNTYRVIPSGDAYGELLKPKTNAQIEDCLKNGYMTLSKRQDGETVIEQDLNSLHTYDENKNYMFSKNKVIRLLDELCNEVRRVFENNYIGKVSNNDAGRGLFRAEIVGLINQLIEAGSIQDFDSSTDISVSQGESIDSVVVDLAIMPADAIEKLYMTINVGRSE